ncbi:MAG: hypothetical protein WBE91_19655 [Steroidobacteraceae bacterium]
MRNFCVVTPGALWRGETPTRPDAQWLVDHGLRTVVSLQLDVRPSFESVHTAPGVVRPVTYFRVRDFAATQVLTHRHLDDHVAEQWRYRLQPVGRFDCRAGRCRLLVGQRGAGLYPPAR